MEKSEFVPGVLFHMPGINQYLVYRVEEIESGVKMIGRAGIILDGKFFGDKNMNRERYHLTVTTRGFKLWTVADSVYLNSKTISFEDLTKVELPSELVTQSQPI